jgi:hypothetical protein
MADTLNIFFFISQMLAALLLPLIILVVGMFIVSNIFKRAKQRTDNAQSMAAETGLTYVGADSFHSIPGYQYFRLFNLGSGYGRQIDNTVKGSKDGFKVSVFDYTYYETFSTRKIRKQTVVMIDSFRLNLPLFSLNPKGKGIFQKIGNAFINDLKLSPSLSDKYLLFGTDKPRIEQIFDNKALSYFDAVEGFTVEGGGSRILFYRDEMLAAPNQQLWMIDEGMKIASLFAR